MTIETFFNLVVVIFTLGNLEAMELNVREAIEALRSAKVVVLICCVELGGRTGTRLSDHQNPSAAEPTPLGLAPRMRGAGW